MLRINGRIRIYPLSGDIKREGAIRAIKVWLGRPTVQLAMVDQDQRYLASRKCTQYVPKDDVQSTVRTSGAFRCLNAFSSTSPTTLQATNSHQETIKRLTKSPCFPYGLSSSSGIPLVRLNTRWRHNFSPWRSQFLHLIFQLQYHSYHRLSIQLQMECSVLQARNSTKGVGLPRSGRQEKLRIAPGSLELETRCVQCNWQVSRF